jgi:hypothetical protein
MDYNPASQLPVGSLVPAAIDLEEGYGFGNCTARRNHCAQFAFGA